MSSGSGFNLKLISLLLAGCWQLPAARPFEIATARDTIIVVPADSLLRLSHRPLIAGEFQLFREGVLVPEPDLYPVQGIVRLQGGRNDSIRFIASYNYLSPSPPLTVGPRVLDLPTLTATLRPSDQPDSGRAVPLPSPLPPQDELFAAGSIYRGVELSPFGGTDFSGGLRLQLQGRLGPDLQVNGVLTDESLPIQPEGNTQTIDEIDQVYLQVSHTLGSVTAGDIDFNLQQGKFLNLNRRLTGLSGVLATQKFKSQAVYAGAKGNYQQLLLKGVDGFQGPYSLTSVAGSRDIVVVAGSEKVYIDGQRLTRGENNDYVIDYSVGEVTFTARRLIHADSDIQVEYQYSDFNYSRSLVGANWESVGSGKAKFAIGWLREQDDTGSGQLNLSTAETDSLRRAGDREIHIDGAQADSSGDYYLLDGIYVYRDFVGAGQSAPRFNVTFRNTAEQGAYRRAVTAGGQLYYEFVPETERHWQQDLYSPVRVLTAPERRQLLQVTADMRPLDNLAVTTRLALSDQDLNRLSDRDDADNLGWAYELNIVGQGALADPDWHYDYRVNNWGRTDRFRTLQRDREVRFERDWNLTDNNIAAENLLSGGIGLSRRELWDINLDWSQYRRDRHLKTSQAATVSGGSGWLPEVNGYYRRMAATGEMLLQTGGRIALLPGNLHPYLDYSTELNKDRSRFDQRIAGLNYATAGSQAQLGIGRRADWSETDSTEAGLESLSRNYFGNIDLVHRSTGGWNLDLTFRKSLKSEYLTGQDYDFELLRTDVSFNNRQRPLQWDLKTKLEETFTEGRAVVYDSVGVGLGTHRYDSGFNEYVPDLNGAYIGYSVPTGDRSPTTRFDGIQRLRFDFSRTGWTRLHGLSARLELRSEFRGRRFGTSRLVRPGLGDDGISRAQWNALTEIDLQLRGSGRRIRAWNRQGRDLNGLDPRGSDLKREREIGIDLTRTVSKNIQAVTRLEQRDVLVNSSLSALRRRAVNGYWLEGGAKWQVERDWQLESTLQWGHDDGNHQQNDFSAVARGVKLEVLRFLGRQGRLQTQLEYYQVAAAEAVAALPPEALHGLALGRSLRANLAGQFLIGANLTATVTANYISDRRYTNLITVTGELRAFF
ncbi:MAG: hypothetical protein ABIA75_09070 [Candidatus Neomarinimicrobiota bacterium]